MAINWKEVEKRAKQLDKRQNIKQATSAVPKNVLTTTKAAPASRNADTVMRETKARLDEAKFAALSPPVSRITQPTQASTTQAGAQNPFLRSRAALSNSKTSQPSASAALRTGAALGSVPPVFVGTKTREAQKDAAPAKFNLINSAISSKENTVLRSTGLSAEQVDSRRSDLQADIKRLTERNQVLGMSRGSLPQMQLEEYNRNAAAIKAATEELKGLERSGEHSLMDTYNWRLEDGKAAQSASARGLSSVAGGLRIGNAETARNALMEAARKDIEARAGAEGAKRDIERVKYVDKYSGKTYEDKFTGQFGASYTLGRLSQDQAMAWSKYLDSPSAENRMYAETIDQLIEQFSENNIDTLDEDAQVKWISQSLAGYLPQLQDQLLHQAGGALAGGTAGLLVGNPAMGAKVGITVASGKYSYQTMRGAAFRNLLALGVDEETARKAANDEAVVSAAIEMADTALDLATLGGGKLLSLIGKGGVKAVAKTGMETGAKGALKKLAAALSKHGINILGEGLEEELQESVSIANEQRLTDGNANASLVAGTAKTFRDDYVLGKNSENRQRIAESGAEGRRIAAMLGGATILGTSAMQRAKQGAKRLGMKDFANVNSPVWNTVAYDDTATQVEITQSVHDAMVTDGSTIVLSDPDGRVFQHYPDLRTVKKAERNNILKQGFSQLKTQLRSFLQDMAVNSFEFEVKGNILDARLYSTGINEVLSKLTQDKATMLYQSEEIFKNAQYLYSTPDYEGNPNIYRWNYFYTPVQIGDDMLGVRIAIRDMKKVNESQIYNWSIKQSAPLDGGRASEMPPSSGVSSDALTRTAVADGGGGNAASHTDSSLDALAINSITQTTQNIKSDSAPANPILKALESKKAEQRAMMQAGESTAINTDPARHTAQEQAVIDEYQNSVDKNLVSFVESAIGNKGANKSRYMLKPVSDRAATDIKMLTGVDTAGYKTVIEQRIAEHIYDRHGPGGSSDNTLRDLNDIGRIQYVLDNYDSMEHGGKTSSYTTIKDNGKPGQAQTVKYIKAVNGTYYVVEAVPNTKAQTTYIVTAFMTPHINNTTEALQTADAYAPAHTAKTDPANAGNANTPVVNKSIPQIMQNIKSDSAPVNHILKTLEAQKAEQQAKRDALARAFVEAGKQREADAKSELLPHGGGAVTVEQLHTIDRTGGVRYTEHSGTKGGDSFDRTGQEDKKGASGQGDADVYGVSENWQSDGERPYTRRNGQLTEIASSRSGRHYRFREIAAAQYSQTQKYVSAQGRQDGVYVRFSQDGGAAIFGEDVNGSFQGFSGVYLGDGNIILAPDGRSYFHELFHHFEALYPEQSRAFSEKTQAEIRFGAPEVMAYLNQMVTEDMLQSEIAARVYNSLRNGRFVAEWDGFFSNPQAVADAYIELQHQIINMSAGEAGSNAGADRFSPADNTGTAFSRDAKAKRDALARAFVEAGKQREADAVDTLQAAWQETDRSASNLYNNYIENSSTGFSPGDVGEVTKYFDDVQLKTETNKASFWSGKTDGVGGEKHALNLANKNGRVTLEGVVEKQGIKMPEWDTSNPASIQAWRDASAAYARQTSGEIIAYVSSTLRPGNFWENVELPNLKANPNVTKIIAIDPKTLAEKVIFVR